MLERDKIKNKRMLVKVYGAAVQGIESSEQAERNTNKNKRILTVFFMFFIYLIELTNLIPYNGQKAIKATGAPCESRRLFL